MDSCRLWKAAGKPGSGPIFNRYRLDKSAYRNGLRSRQLDKKSYYTNNLHEALLKKEGVTFWKCWKSKFESNKHSFHYVDGITDTNVIVEHFASHFSKACTNSSFSGANRLKTKYQQIRPSYRGKPINDAHLFDAALTDDVIRKMKAGKAAGIDGITAEHLKYSHALLPVILSKLFNLMMLVGHVPGSFGESYTVPIIKTSSNIYSKSITVNDFRGVSISPVISKVLEHCILDRYDEFLLTNSNQFGFKKRHGCSHAIYTLRCVVDYYVSAGSTVNLCALDLTKAFDKMNHHGLFIKLMDRCIPAQLLLLLENWFKSAVTCVKWGTAFSEFFPLSCGVRQGGVLSPYLFSVYIDGVVDRVRECRVGCFVKSHCVSVLLYADDILLLAPSVTALQQLVLACEGELQWLDMSINVKKSACMRIGPRFSVTCSNINTIDGSQISWCNNIRYLGIYLKTHRVFRCCFDHAKRSFYKAFNAIFGKVGRVASEEVIVQLLKSKCLPVLYYGLDVCPLNRDQVRSLQFAVNSCFRKIFCVRSQTVVDECQALFNCPPISETITIRTHTFLHKYMYLDNELCQVFNDRATAELRA